jgi:hypothetical protein
VPFFTKNFKPASSEWQALFETQQLLLNKVYTFMASDSLKVKICASCAENRLTAVQRFAITVAHATVAYATLDKVDILAHPLASETLTAAHRDYHLVHDIYVVLDGIDRCVFSPYGITNAQYRLLSLLDHRTGDASLT